jgi:hypothetical protein
MIRIRGKYMRFLSSASFHLLPGFSKTLRHVPCGRVTARQDVHKDKEWLCYIKMRGNDDFMMTNYALSRFRKQTTIFGECSYRWRVGRTGYFSCCVFLEQLCFTYFPISSPSFSWENGCTCKWCRLLKVRVNEIINKMDLAINWQLTILLTVN